MRVILCVALLATVALTEGIKLSELGKKGNDMKEDPWGFVDDPWDFLDEEENTLEPSNEEESLWKWNGQNIWHYVNLYGLDTEYNRVMEAARAVTYNLGVGDRDAEKLSHLVIGVLMFLASMAGVYGRIIVILLLVAFGCRVIASVLFLGTIGLVLIKRFGCEDNKLRVSDLGHTMLYVALFGLAIIGCVVQFELAKGRTIVAMGLIVMFITMVAGSGYMVTHSMPYSSMPMIVAACILVALAGAVGTIDMQDVVLQARYGILGTYATRDRKVEYMRAKGLGELVHGMGGDVNHIHLLGVEEQVSLADLIRPGSGDEKPKEQPRSRSWNFIAIMHGMCKAHAIYIQCVGALVVGYAYAIHHMSRHVSRSVLWSFARAQAGISRNNKEEFIDGVLEKMFKKLGAEQVSYMLGYPSGKITALACEVLFYGYMIDGFAAGLMMLILGGVGYLLIGPYVWLHTAGKSWLIAGWAAESDAYLSQIVDVGYTGCGNPDKYTRMTLLGGAFFGAVMMWISTLGLSTCWIGLAPVITILGIFAGTCEGGLGNWAFTLAVALGSGQWMLLVNALVDYKWGVVLTPHEQPARITQ